MKTGSIWIDPGSHKIMKMGSDNTITPSNAIYAVGAMTRGQIIDASMARSIVQSTARIAKDIIGYLLGTADPFYLGIMIRSLVCQGFNFVHISLDIALSLQPGCRHVADFSEYRPLEPGPVVHTEDPGHIRHRSWGPGHPENMCC